MPLISNLFNIEDIRNITQKIGGKVLDINHPELRKPVRFKWLTNTRFQPSLVVGYDYNKFKMVISDTFLCTVCETITNFGNGECINCAVRSCIISNDKCPICYEELVNENYIITEECNHSFHSKCWRKLKNVDPISNHLTSDIANLLRKQLDCPTVESHDFDLRKCPICRTYTSSKPLVSVNYR